MGSTKPRLVVELTDEQYDRLSLLMPFGLRTRVFKKLVDEVIAVMQRDPVMIYKLLGGQVGLAFVGETEVRADGHH